MTPLSLATEGTAITRIGGAKQRVGFPHTFHRNNVWELTVPVHLEKGRNTIPGVLLRSRCAPLIDRITVAPYAREL